MKCQGSGFVIGGYRQEFEGKTLKVRCVDCWKMVEAVPIEPEPRTDIYKDGRMVMVVRKRLVDHEAGSVWAIRWRRDGHIWLLLTAIFITVINIMCLVLF